MSLPARFLLVDASQYVNELIKEWVHKRLKKPKISLIFFASLSIGLNEVETSIKKRSSSILCDFLNILTARERKNIEWQKKVWFVPEKVCQYTKQWYSATRYSIISFLE